MIFSIDSVYWLSISLKSPIQENVNILLSCLEAEMSSHQKIFINTLQSCYYLISTLHSGPTESNWSKARKLILITFVCYFFWNKLKWIFYLFVFFMLQIHSISIPLHYALSYIVQQKSWKIFGKVLSFFFLFKYNN